jgi:hypothetical protein
LFVPERRIAPNMAVHVLKWAGASPQSGLTDIRQIPGGFEARIALVDDLGKGKSPSPRARGD